MLRDEGKLKLDDPLGAYVPEANREGVTIRRALAHSSGIQRETPGDVWETMDFPDRETLLAAARRGGAGARARQAVALLEPRLRAPRRGDRARRRACPPSEFVDRADPASARPGAHDVGAGRERRDRLLRRALRRRRRPRAGARQEGGRARGGALQHRRRPGQVGRFPHGAGRDACRPGDGRSPTLAARVGRSGSSCTAAASGIFAGHDGGAVGHSSFLFVLAPRAGRDRSPHQHREPVDELRRRLAHREGRGGDAGRGRAVAAGRADAAGARRRARHLVGRGGRLVVRVAGGEPRSPPARRQGRHPHALRARGRGRLPHGRRAASTASCCESCATRTASP